MKYGSMQIPCIYTVVINTSGVEKFFGFLPPHGRRLGVGEQLAIPGNLVSTLGARYYSKRRDFDGFERALKQAKLAIISTPEVILYDPTAEDSKALSLNNGTLGISNPCYGAETGIASLTSAT